MRFFAFMLAVAVAVAVGNAQDSVTGDCSDVYGEKDRDILTSLSEM